MYMRLVVRLLSGAVFLTAESRELAIAQVAGLDALPFAVMPHPIYGQHYPPSPSKTAARRHFNLPIDRKIVGMVGDLKSYKGADDFLRAFGDVESSEIHGFLAGKAQESELARNLQRAAACAVEKSQTLTHADRRLSDLELVTALAALDLLVLPYKNGENSGMAILAAERGTPILARANSSTEELISLLGHSTIQPFTGELDSAKLSAAVIAAQPPTGEALAAFRQRHSAEAAAATLKSFFQSISGIRKIH
jgi:glycosyltransferase involved in cell wall biosynthesis